MVPFEMLRPDELVPDIALRQRYSARDGKRIVTYPE
ncbi:hypothetical protein AEGHOMDF_2928 [Methylobacterium soli]|nr:hypothetical protein AEGHOMDF_2928 [Methylobacterium soli]